MGKAPHPFKPPAFIKAAAEFFRERAGEARPEDLHAVLALAPDRAPDPGDEPPKP